MQTWFYVTTFDTIFWKWSCLLYKWVRREIFTYHLTWRVGPSGTIFLSVSIVNTINLLSGLQWDLDRFRWKIAGKFSSKNRWKKCKIARSKKQNRTKLLHRLLLMSLNPLLLVLFWYKVHQCHQSNENKHRATRALDCGECHMQFWKLWRNKKNSHRS